MLDGSCHTDEKYGVYCDGVKEKGTGFFYRSRHELRSPPGMKITTIFSGDNEGNEGEGRAPSWVEDEDDGGLTRNCDDLLWVKPLTGRIA